MKLLRAAVILSAGGVERLCKCSWGKWFELLHAGSSKFFIFLGSPVAFRWDTWASYVSLEDLSHHLQNFACNHGEEYWNNNQLQVLDILRISSDNCSLSRCSLRRLFTEASFCWHPLTWILYGHHANFLIKSNLKVALWRTVQAGGLYRQC